MDPILSEIYSTVMPAAPYVIGAYALIWAILLVFLGLTLAKIARVKREVAALRDGMKLLEKKLEAQERASQPRAQGPVEE